MSPVSSRPALLAVASILAYGISELVSERLFYGPDVEFSFWGVQAALAHCAAIMAGLLIGTLVLRRTDLFAPAIALTFAIGALTTPLVWLWYARNPDAEPDPLLVIAIVQLPAMLALLWLAGGPGLRRLAGLAPAAGLLGAALLFEQFLFFDPMLVEPWDEATYQPLDIEALYTAQDRLLSDQIAALPAQRPGLPEVFALTLGGTASQSVFLSEVDGIAEVLDAQYGSGPRTLRLANSEDDPTRYPLANRANLSRALDALGARMGPEDVAFLALTSHGAPDRFSLSFDEAGTTDLTAAELAGMLDHSGIGSAVIVLQACFAGSFIDDLAAPGRLIVTAASARRTSFGCADGRAWTEFGQSFFDLALRAEPDPRKAFEVARRNVRGKELLRFTLFGSDPQIFEGAAIGPALDLLLSQRLADASR